MSISGWYHSDAPPPNADKASLQQLQVRKCACVLPPGMQGGVESGGLVVLQRRSALAAGRRSMGNRLADKFCSLRAMNLRKTQLRDIYEMDIRVNMTWDMQFYIDSISCSCAPAPTPPRATRRCPAAKGGCRMTTWGCWCGTSTRCTSRRQGTAVYGRQGVAVPVRQR